MISYLYFKNCISNISGCEFGNVLTLGLSGAICKSSLGWPSVFFLCGAIGLLFSAVWFNTVTDHPPDTPADIFERKQVIIVLFYR